MTSARILVLVLFCAASAIAADPDDIREMKERALAKRRVTANAQTPTPKTITVDCTKGEKIQDAVDKNAPPLDILVNGPIR